jgi:signal transduction histidine kinase
LEAAAAIEIACHVAGGGIDALIADPDDSFPDIAVLVAEIRKRNPQCLFWIFTAAAGLGASAYVGCGVDGLTEKNSEGYLGIGAILSERIRTATQLQEYLPWGGDAGPPGAFPTPACLLSDKGVIAAVSRNFERMLERPRFELVGRPFGELLEDAAQQEEWRRQFSSGASGAARCELVAAVRVASSRRLMAAIAAIPWNDPGAGRGLWGVSVLDVTRTVNTPAAGAAPGPPPESDSVLYEVAHDLQAPLNALVAHAGDLERADFWDSQARLSVREIGELTTRMQLMLDGILEVASVRASLREPEIVNLEGAVHDAIANLHNEIESSGATVEILPLPTLRVNRLQMVRVFQNLIGNAIKYRGNPVPRNKNSSKEQGDSVRVLVKDNGIGLDPKDAGRIFGLFQRLHGEKEYPGMGVGLAICRQILRSHGGEIRVESTPGSGACFVLEFPGTALGSAVNVGSEGRMVV